MRFDIEQTVATHKTRMNEIVAQIKKKKTNFNGLFQTNDISNIGVPQTHGILFPDLIYISISIFISSIWLHLLDAFGYSFFSIVDDISITQIYIKNIRKTEYKNL